MERRKAGQKGGQAGVKSEQKKFMIKNRRRRRWTKIKGEEKKMKASEWEARKKASRKQRKEGRQLIKEGRKAREVDKRNS